MIYPFNNEDWNFSLNLEQMRYKTACLRKHFSKFITQLNIINLSIYFTTIISHTQIP